MNSLIEELKNKGRVDSNTVDMISSLSFEELIGIKIETVAALACGKVYGFRLAQILPKVTKDAVMNYIVRQNITNRAGGMLSGYNENYISKYKSLIRKLEKNPYESLYDLNWDLNPSVVKDDHPVGPDEA